MGTRIISIGLLMITLLSASCGSQVKKKAPEQSIPKDADLTRAVNCGAASELHLTDDLFKVPAENIILTQNDTESDLCTRLRDMAKPLAIVQFASVECYACQRWIDLMDTELQEGSYKDVAHFVIFSDNVLSLSERGAKRIIDEMAPNASYGMDYSGAAWRFFTPGFDQTDDVMPFMLVMDMEARGFSITDTEVMLADVLDLANANLGIKSLPAE